MTTALQRMDRNRELAGQAVKGLAFAVGGEVLDEAKKRLALTFGATPGLFDCTEESIAYAIALSAMSGLYPGGQRPDVWLIPRKNRNNNNAKEINWQISARGYRRLAIRAGYQARAMVVHKHDAFEYEAAAPSLIHRPDVDKGGDWESIRLAYLRVTDQAGAVDFYLLRKDQIEKRRKGAQDDGIWASWPEEQTLKTMYAYAGAREAWPTDEPTRFAMAATMAQDVGEDSFAPRAASAGRQMLVADLRDDEPAEADPVDLATDGEKAELKKTADACGVSFTMAYTAQGWPLPTEGTPMTAARADELEGVLRAMGREKGGCETCGTICEQSFCSEDCETRAGKAQ